jgi:hypothetical protein
MAQQRQRQQLDLCRLLRMTELLSWQSQCLTSCGRTLTRQMTWACLSALRDIAWVGAVWRCSSVYIRLHGGRCVAFGLKRVQAKLRAS